MDTEFKAYLLGWIASDGTIGKNYSIVICIRDYDVKLLEVLAARICSTLSIKKIRENMVALTISSKQWYNDIKRHLCLKFKGSESHKKSRTVEIPLMDEKLERHFIRGMVEGDGHIIKQTRVRSYGITMGITSNSIALLQRIGKISRDKDINCSISKDVIQWSGKYAAAALEFIYANCDEELILPRKHNQYCLFKGEVSRFWERSENIISKLF